MHTIVFDEQVGFKNYELSNHLGNVLATVTDRKVPDIDVPNSLYNHFNAQITSIADCYPFGMQIEERSWTAPSNKYRFGFNGKERDDEGMGGGKSTYDYGFRIYNPAIAKFLSVDPLTKDYTYYSPYAYAGNTPIKFIDLDGLETYDPGTGDDFLMSRIVLTTAYDLKHSFLNTLCYITWLASHTGSTFNVTAPHLRNRVTYPTDKNGNKIFGTEIVSSYDNIFDDWRPHANAVLDAANIATIRSFDATDLISVNSQGVTNSMVQAVRKTW